MSIEQFEHSRNSSIWAFEQINSVIIRNLEDLTLEEKTFGNLKKMVTNRKIQTIILSIWNYTKQKK